MDKNLAYKNGFTLIELIITLAIFCLIASFSYPSYQNFIIRSHRNDAKIALHQLANNLEQFYAKHHSYKQATIAPNGSKDTQVLSTNLSPQKWYQLKITAQSHHSYTLMAFPIGSQKKDHDCASYILNSLGQISVSGQLTIERC